MLIGVTAELLVSSPGGVSSRGYEDLDASLISSAKQMIKFASYYADLHTGSFDWTGFNNTVDAYGHKHSDLSVVRSESGSFHQNNASVSDMVNKIVPFIMDKFHVSVAFDSSYMAGAIAGAFGNLKSSKENGFADFASSSSSHSSYTYRLMLHYPHDSDLNKSNFLITTITLGASIEQESSWWGLSGSIKSDFSADIIGRQLEVGKGFYSPFG